jgi:hypothetical protein
MKLTTSLRAFLAVMVLACVPLAARAATITFKATLAPSAEVKGSHGHGALTATLDTVTNTLKYHATYAGLTGPATAAHFHGPADPGANAGPQVPVANPASPIDGTATITAAQAKDLLAGKWYFNVHTAANPGGEIRGQVTH